MTKLEEDVVDDPEDKYSKKTRKIEKIMTDKSKEGSFVSHLTELRTRLINSLIFIFIIFIIGYIFAENIYNF